MEEQVTELYALQQGFLDGVAPADVRGRLKRLIKQMLVSVAPEKALGSDISVDRFVKYQF